MNLCDTISIAIVCEDCAPLILDAISKASITQVISFPARGTAEKSLLQSLGLGQTKKTLIAFRQNKYDKQKAFFLCNNALSSLQKKTGILFTIFTEKKTMNKVAKNLVVCVIVNAGYAEDVMQEARKAGSRGGTIINARGTGTEQDMDFFGIQVVPEKEMLVMVAETALAEKLVKVIKNMPLLSSPGSGIVFTLETDGYSRLGGNDD